MTSPKYIGIYFTIFLVMLLIDMVWLRVIAVTWYQQAMGPLISDTPNLYAAAAFYFLFPLGLMIFGVLPQADASVLKAVAMGALFGFFAYATYDLTNLAVIKNWPLGLTFLDIAWGTFVSGVSVGAGKLTLDYLKV
jgi:uncharacterized membrane protein